MSLNMGAGEMTVASGDTSAVAEATFEYGTAQMKPETSYDVNGSTGTLKISQPDIHYKFGDSYPNSWDVQLAQEHRLRAERTDGRGVERLDLSDVDVRRWSCVSAPASRRWT